MNKLLLSYILTIGLSAAAGVGTGIVLKKTVGPIDEMYPPGFDPAEFSPNTEEIMKKYNSRSDRSYNGVKDFEDYELINVVSEKFKQCENCYSISIGEAKTIVTQTIRNAQIKNGNEYFEDQLSYSSMVALAKRSYQHGKDGEIDVYDGTATDSEVASYGAKTASYNKKDYKDLLGKSLDEMFIYIISEKTVLDSSRSVKGNDVIVKLNLDPNLSTFYYKTQMLNLSGLSNLPPFSEVKLTYTFSKNLALTHISVDETFVATKAGIPVPATTNNVIEIYYYADQYYQIPDVNTLIPFSKIVEEA